MPFDRMHNDDATVNMLTWMFGITIILGLLSGLFGWDKKD
jgi:hypothetical protein